MSEMRDRKEFVKRTKEILKKEFYNFVHKDREVTFLLNCLLGLIVTVSEIEKAEGNKVLDGEIDDKFLALIPKKIGFVNEKDGVDEDLGLINKKTVAELNIHVCHWDELSRKKKSWLLSKIRNGIAHLNIEWENDNEKIKAIKLWNKPFGPKNAKKKDFEIIFEIEKLRKFAIGLSTKYLNSKKTR